MKTYYKVVRIEKFGHEIMRGSINAYRLDVQLDKQYIPEKWIDADPLFLSQGFGLCVFDSFGPAKNCFLNSHDQSYDPMELWECEVKSMQVENSPYRCSVLERVYDVNQLKKYTSRSFGWPKGTVLVESVKLTKKIQ